MTLRFINGLRKAVFVLVLLVAIVYAATPSVSDDFTERRITAGAKIFRALLAADIDIPRKTDAGGKLRLGLLYLDDTGNAELAAATLVNRDDPRIRKMKVHIDMLSFTECIADNKGRLAGIFLTQRVTAEQLQTLSAFADARHLVVFSPFEGDVERGVQSGIAVEARVRPYLNTHAMRNARIRLKSFFLKVAKTYEE
ncbi:MAG: hypothetical protein P8X96_12055 [Desulfobacteraceae bacterium]